MADPLPANNNLASISAWLIGPARESLSPGDIVAGLVTRLREAGVVLSRVRMGQSVANPMISAWGVIWTREAGVELYQVQRSVLSTSSYHGSPIEAVIQTRRSYRRSLVGLDPALDHPVLIEQAAAGGTDYLAVPVIYGGNLLQVTTFVTDRPRGFRGDDIVLIEGLIPAIASAMEPAAMRHSTESLLEVYLGSGPASRVINGEFQRGHTTEIEAAIVICDLRGFTALSEQLPPQQLLESLGGYFEIVVDAMRQNGGDVLKFIGDGVLSLFPVGAAGAEGACRSAAKAIVRAHLEGQRKSIDFVSTLHVGPVVYGNIGSPDRLDFTVVGPTVNFASRLETIAKSSGRRAVCSHAAGMLLPPASTEYLGTFEVRGLSEPQRVMALRLETESMLSS